MKLRLLFLLMLLSQAVTAQYIKHAIGARGGISNGLTYHYYYQEDRETRAMLSFRDNGLQLTAMLVKNEALRLPRADQFFVYYGAGMHAGFTRNKSMLWYFSHNSDQDASATTRPVIGADGIFGLEYRIYTVPISFAVDYKPFFELFGHRIFRLSMGDFAFSLKYHF